MTKATELPWNAFAREDWWGLPGAERFPNGDEPLIAYFERNNEHRTFGMIVVDGRGIQITFMDDHGGHLVVFDKEFELTPGDGAAEGFERARDTLRQIVPEKATRGTLITAGFDLILAEEFDEAS
jgi:hypothetical protein